MMIFKRISDVPYVVTVDSVDAHDAANKEKFFPAKWLSEDGNDVKPEAVRYFLPLIQGEVKIAMKNGMPVHFKL
jgi:6-phosphofructokinase